MTQIKFYNYKCPKCDTVYDVYQYISWHVFSESDLETDAHARAVQECPKCHTPYDRENVGAHTEVQPSDDDTDFNIPAFVRRKMKKE